MYSNIGLGKLKDSGYKSNIGIHGNSWTKLNDLFFENHLLFQNNLGLDLINVGLFHYTHTSY